MSVKASLTGLETLDEFPDEAVLQVTSGESLKTAIYQRTKLLRSGQESTVALSPNGHIRGRLRVAPELPVLTYEWPSLHDAAPDGIMRFDLRAHYFGRVTVVEGGSHRPLPRASVELVSAGSLPEVRASVTTDVDGAGVLMIPAGSYSLSVGGKAAGAGVVQAGAALQFSVSGFGRLSGSYEGPLVPGASVYLVVTSRTRPTGHAEAAPTDDQSPGRAYRHTVPIDAGSWSCTLPWPNGTAISLTLTVSGQSEHGEPTTSVVGDTTVTLRWEDDAPCVVAVRPVLDGKPAGPGRVFARAVTAGEDPVRYIRGLPVKGQAFTARGRIDPLRGRAILVLPAPGAYAFSYLPEGATENSPERTILIEAGVEEYDLYVD